MSIKDNKGSISIFQIISIAMIISVFALLSSALIHNKTENNLKRAEKLVSESILNTYDKALYKGFSLLAYKYDKELIDDIKKFYEEKYNVSIEVNPSKRLSDENMFIQMKSIVVARLGVSYLDDMLIKFEQKDKILEAISDGKSILEKAESNLQAYDELVLVMSSLAEVFIDIKNGASIIELDDKHGIAFIKSKLDKAISLENIVLENSSKGLSDSSSTGLISVIEYGSSSISSSSQEDMMDNIRQLERLINLSYQGQKSNGGDLLTEDGNDPDIDKKLLELGKNLIIEYDYSRERSNNYASEEGVKISKVYSKIKSIHKEKSKEIYSSNNIDEISFKEESHLLELDESNLSDKEVDRNSSDLKLNLIDKIAFIEYLTTMLSDEVLSSKRDHYSSDRESINGYAHSELEYVITGYSANKSKSKVKNFIRIIRFPLNLSHIYYDGSKRESINRLSLAIATILPIPAFITSPIIASSWAMIETQCDIYTIYDGGSVILIKTTSDDWASDFGYFESLMESSSGPASERKVDLNKKTDNKENKKEDFGKLSGFYYNDYLRLMALTKRTSDMMTRFKNLVYIYIEDEDFFINDLVIEHKIDIYMDYEHRYKFKETLIDGYIK